MGKTSIFSFSLSGRRRPSIESNNSRESLAAAGRPLSKAQKILGTADLDLNIDSPTREDNKSWRSFTTRPASSGRSIATSFTTLDDNISISPSVGTVDHIADAPLRGKASSTLLGRRYQDDVKTDASSTRRKLQSKNSASTLQSYYDRQKLPLAVTQQTSESSARDLALRKGYPPVAQVDTPTSDMARSPLLDEDSLTYTNIHTITPQNMPPPPNGPEPKKKPARLDLTKLFPKPRSGGGPVLGDEHLTKSPSALSFITTDTRRSSKSRKSLKQDGKSPKSQPFGPKSPLSPRKGNMNRLSDLVEDRESVSKSRLALAPTFPQRDTASYTHLTSEQKYGQLAEMRDLADSLTEDEWTRASLALPPWTDTQSVASVSSRRTREPEHTSASVISSADLQNSSVLCMSSSDSESGDETVLPRLSHPKQVLRKASAEVLKSPTMTSGMTNRPSTAQDKRSSRRRQPQDENFLTIPLPPLAGSRLSGPWNPPPRKQSPLPNFKQPVLPRTPESPVTPELQPTPKTEDFPAVPVRGSRLMAVTQQEEALLAALRQKRARMKESIIAEHESKSPPTEPLVRHSTRTSRASTSSAGTVKMGPNGETHRVLLYLDASPVQHPNIGRNHDIDIAEQSPDLSDFLSFGSDDDDDSTPRSSWAAAPRKEHNRADSETSPGFTPRYDVRDSPKTPQSAARLSAVGVDDIHKDIGVPKHHPTDFLDELDVVWGL